MDKQTSLYIAYIHNSNNYTNTFEIVISDRLSLSSQQVVKGLVVLACTVLWMAAVTPVVHPLTIDEAVSVTGANVTVGDSLCVRQ